MVTPGTPIRRGQILDIQTRSGQTPAVALSDPAYHDRTGFVFVCPIAMRRVLGDFSVPLPEHFPLAGFVLAHEVRAVDLRERVLRVHDDVLDAAALARIQNVIAAILGLPHVVPGPSGGAKRS